MKLLRITCIACAAMFLSIAAQAQDVYKRIKADPEYSGCYYRSYPVPESPADASLLPDGYEPFYISHYGRHGSRWVSSAKKYKRAGEFMQKAADNHVLTAKGKELKDRLDIILADAKDRNGDLSPKGALEHKGIAKRMYENYREAFTGENGKPVKISSVATLSPRCILSMAAFNESLKEQDPELELTREASNRYLYYMHNYQYTDDVYKTCENAADSLVEVWVKPDRFLKSIISDKDYIRDSIKRPQRTMFDFFHIASDMQCVDYLGIDLYDIFTQEELYNLWRTLNAHTYTEEGASFRFGDLLMKNAKNLVQNFVDGADAVISGKSDVAAHLRFGHESNIVPFMALIGVKAVAVRTTPEKAEHCWNISEVCPMATNMQFIFFRNAAGNIKVRVLHNEKDAELPVEGAPFYDWALLRSYLLQKAAL